MFIFTGFVDKKNCSSPVERPGTFAGYVVSDTELGVRFTKPINDDYDYLLYYKVQTDPLYTLVRYWTTYGPVWSDTIDHLQPNTDYKIRLRLACSHNSSVFGGAETDYKKTFAKRKSSSKG